MKILLIDDDPFIRELISQILDAEGFNVETAGNAEEAMFAIENGPPDLIITDIVMPEKSGTDFIRDLKDRDIQIPVLAITAGVENAQQDYVNQAEMFADATLAKPLVKDELLKTINDLTSGGAQEAGVSS